MRVYKSGFQKQGTSQQALKSDLTHLEHLLNDEIKTKSGVVPSDGKDHSGVTLGTT